MSNSTERRISGLFLSFACLFLILLGWQACNRHKERVKTKTELKSCRKNWEECQVTVGATIRQLFENAKAYYEEGYKVVKEGANIQIQFPDSAPLTPAAPCCRGPNQQCQNGSVAWSHPTWQTLKFQLKQPFEWQFQFISMGKGDESKAIIRAVGQERCDGPYLVVDLPVWVDQGAALISKDSIKVYEVKMLRELRP
jgi:hypothetical protein